MKNNPCPKLESQSEHVRIMVKAAELVNPEEVPPHDVVSLLKWMTTELTRDFGNGDLVRDALEPWLEEMRDGFVSDEDDVITSYNEVNDDGDFEGPDFGIDGGDDEDDDGDDD